jgi:short subunit dehydrogenase-like uncharacterized protein
MMATDKRLYDIVIFGATGFTGQLVAEYFAAKAPKDIQWAISGRNREKLLEIKSALCSKYPSAEKAGWIVADSQDAASLDALCSATKIIATTVGPYAHYGEPLVKACLKHKTHYLDITGEPDFVKALLHQYDALAKANNTLIISCCGFDSIPADAGAFFTALQLPDGRKSIQGYVTASGTFSGGTWASAIHAFSKLKDGSTAPRSRSDQQKGQKGPVLPTFHFSRETGKWAAPMPVIDPWMVQRSSECRPDVYGADFSYAQYIGFKRLPAMGGLLLGVGALVAASQFSFSRKLLLGYRKSGEGPTAEERAKAYFKLTFVGKSSGTTKICSVSGGDPGYTETAKMLSESALTVLLHYDELPAKGGVMTPAGAMGKFLIDRLVAAGIRFKVES